MQRRGATPGREKEASILRLLSRPGNPKAPGDTFSWPPPCLHEEQEIMSGICAVSGVAPGRIRSRLKCSLGHALVNTRISQSLDYFANISDTHYKWDGDKRIGRKKKRHTHRTGPAMALVRYVAKINGPVHSGVKKEWFGPVRYGTFFIDPLFFLSGPVVFFVDPVQSGTFSHCNRARAR